MPQVERNTQKKFQMEVIAHEEGVKFYYQCTETDSVLDLKKKIQAQHEVPVPWLHIYFMEKELEDEDMLQTEAWDSLVMVIGDPYPDHINEVYPPGYGGGLTAFPKKDHGKYGAL